MHAAPCPLSGIPVRAGMDFHKELHRIEAKEGLRGRKLQKALESFAWNITVLKVRGKGCVAPSPPHPATPAPPTRTRGMLPGMLREHWRWQRPGQAVPVPSEVPS